MNFKKRVNGSWTDAPHYIHNTSTDTLTTLPADIYANDTTATVGLKGQAVQSGTLTPENPVMPQGTGERTANLWDEDYTGINTNAIYRPLFVGDGVFTLSTNFKPNQGLTDIFLLSGNVSSGISSSTNGAYEGKNITAQSVNGYITIAYRANARPNSGSLPYCKTMLNTGSTPLPYEIFGYKIPILNNSQTTNVYLGEVESTRQIKKLVLKGTESWVIYGGNYFSSVIDSDSRQYKLCYCTHLESTFSSGIYVDSGGSRLKVFSASVSSVATTLAEWKTYLQQQYANGTPVTVWYVLVTPETAVVNEPLMKIGDYADEVSGVSIPTIAGANTIDVDTTLQPSEVSVTYHGWHPVADVHEASRTVNIYDKYNTIDIQDFGVRYGVYCGLGNYSIYNNTNNNVYWFDNGGVGRFLACSPHSTSTVYVTGVEPVGFYMPYNDASLGEITIVEGTTVPDHYIPYIDWD